MTVSSFQNANYFTGSSGLATYTQTGTISEDSLLNSDYAERRYNYRETVSKYNNLTTGQDAAINTYASNIGMYLAEGREDIALESYNELLEEMSKQEQYASLIRESGDDTQLRAIARELIEAELGGDLAKYIKENCRDAAGVEEQQILYGKDMCDSTSSEDLLKEMCNINEEKGELNAFQVAGAKILNVVNPTKWNWAPWFTTKKVS